MKLKEYLLVLSKLIEQDSSLLECEVVYEDHHNKIKKLDSSPVVGHISGTQFHAMSPVPFVEKVANNAIKLV
jgi:hypothetical protein